MLPAGSPQTTPFPSALTKSSTSQTARARTVAISRRGKAHAVSPVRVAHDRVGLNLTAHLGQAVVDQCPFPSREGTRNHGDNRTEPDHRQSRLLPRCSGRQWPPSPKPNDCLGQATRPNASVTARADRHVSEPDLLQDPSIDASHRPVHLWASCPLAVGGWTFAGPLNAAQVSGRMVEL